MGDREKESKREHVMRRLQNHSDGSFLLIVSGVGGRVSAS